jgi:hypothetical protein
MENEEYCREIREIVESHEDINTGLESLAIQCCLNKGSFELFVKSCEDVCNDYLSRGCSSLEDFQHLSIVAYHGANAAEHGLTDRAKTLYKIAAEASLKVSNMARDSDTKEFASYLREQFLQKSAGVN